MPASERQDTPDGMHDEETDHMADAPAERPYADAVSDSHRAFLESRGVPVGEGSKTES